MDLESDQQIYSIIPKLEVLAPTADTSETSCPNIEVVDIKTEPPDSTDTDEYSGKSLPVVKSGTNLRIESMQSEVMYKSAKNMAQSSNTVNNINNLVNPHLEQEGKFETQIQIKEEMDTSDVFTPEISISYDIPSLEKTGNSAESSQPEGEDLRKSLQEEIVLKVEVEEITGEGDCPGEEILDERYIKIEEPTLASQNITKNIISVQANDERGHNSGQRSVIMQIIPMDTVSQRYATKKKRIRRNIKKMELSSQSKPDQMTQLHVYDSGFQLNSITGNMLSLEQEAYGLLQAKNQTAVVEHLYTCTKCPKKCRDKGMLKRHLKVHETIERRAEGVARGKKTRELNKSKREINLMKIGTSKDLTHIPYDYAYNRNGEPRKGSFKCKMCKKEYRVLSCLRRHQRSCSELKTEVKDVQILGREVRRAKLKAIAQYDPTIHVVSKKKQPINRNRENKEYKCPAKTNDPTENVVSKKKQAINRNRENEEYKCPTKTNNPTENVISKKKQAINRNRENEEYKCPTKINNPTENVLSKKKQAINRNRENEEYKCECGKTFSRRSPMETCLRSHHPEIESQTYSCNICTKSFKEKSELMLHKKRQHVKKKFLCKFCPMDYHTPKELFKHLRVHKKVQMMEFKVISEVVEGEQALKCFMCRKTFTELSELKAHVLVDHKEPYTCLHCRQKFPKIVDFATHTKSAHPEVEGQSVLDVLEALSVLAQAWKCEECHVQFEDPDNLVKHQTEHHGPANKRPTENSEEYSKFQFRCEDCRRTFITLKQLSVHRNIHHSIKHENLNQNDKAKMVPERMTTPPPPLPMCVHCRKVCKDEATLTSHLRLHSIDRKYPCKFCDFRFATVEKRKSHATIHTGDMKYVCFICEYRCSSENRLKYHKQTPKHLDMKESLLNGLPYEPQVPVEKPEVKKKRHSSHKKKSGRSEEPSTCDICGEAFPNEKAMLIHKDTHPFIVFPNEGEPKRIFFK